MAIFIDTNIIIELVRDNNSDEMVSNYINPKKEVIYISYVSAAEVASFAIQNEWGDYKVKKLEGLLNEFIIVELQGDVILKRYVEIDTFSQGKNKTILSKLSQNMGKNDLWIASSASILDIPLITTDKDFDHLHEIFLDVVRIPASVIKTLKAKK